MGMKCFLNVELFDMADDIAAAHIRRGWFESFSSALTRKMRLRTAIYNALVEVSALTAQEPRHGRD
jgi:hypothetical protein